MSRRRLVTAAWTWLRRLPIRVVIALLTSEPAHRWDPPRRAP